MRPNFPSLEETLKRMGDEPGWGSKFLIGGLLGFVPIVQLFTMGYLLQYARRIRREMELTLPEWTGWGALFMDGLRMLVVWLLFFLFPFLIGFFLYGLFRISIPGLPLVGSMAWLFLAAGWLAGCYFFMAALYRYVALGSFRSLLDLRTLWRMAFAMRWQLALPVLLLTGMVALLFPIYGFAFFFGYLIMVAYSTLNYMLMERAAGINR